MIKEIWGLLKHNRGAVLALALVSLFCLVALLAPWIAPFDPNQIFSESLKLPPAWAVGGQSQFWLGTDDVGRDVFSRLVHGSRISLGIGFFGVLFTTVFGTLLGLLAGSMGRWVEGLILRTMDILMALPSLLLAIVVVSILGPSLINTVIAISLVALPQVVRIVRSSVMVEKEKSYVKASRTFGGGWFHIYVRNVLPNCMAPLLVQATFGFSDSILNAAAFGFLGLGVQPPTPEWGTMLADARSFMESSPWLVTLPGLCILVVVVGFNLLGDGLRDALDPKTKEI